MYYVCMCVYMYVCTYVSIYGNRVSKNYSNFAKAFLVSHHKRIMLANKDCINFRLVTAIKQWR